MKNEEKKAIKVNLKKVLVNCITAVRSLGSVAIVPIFTNCGSLTTALAVIAFFATDFIDGFLARKLHVQSFFGCLLDALSDKAFGIICLLLLGTLNPIFLTIPLIELGITAINYQSIQRGNNVHSSMVGKAKTVLLAASVVGGFFSYAAPSLKELLNYINVSALDTVLNTNPDILSTLFAVPTIAAGTYVGIDYFVKAKKQDKARDQALTEEAKAKLGGAPSIEEIEQKKKELIELKKEILELKSGEEIKHDLFDTEFYLKHCDDGIKRLLYKNKGSE